MNSSKSTALVLLSDPQISVAVDILKLQSITLKQIKLIAQMERDGALRAIIVGIALHRIKASVNHGEFMPWIKENVEGAGYNQANYYMRLALAFTDRACVTMPELLSLPVDGTEFALDSADAFARRFLEKAQNFVGDRSLNELLREHGIKDAAPRGGARERGLGAPVVVDPEQLYLFARDEIGLTLQRAESLFLTENRLQFLVGHPEEIRGVVESLRNLADKVEAAAKPLLKKTA
jgi:hypothetical protein